MNNRMLIRGQEFKGIMLRLAGIGKAGTGLYLQITTALFLWCEKPRTKLHNRSCEMGRKVQMGKGTREMGRRKGRKGQEGKNETKLL